MIPDWLLIFVVAVAAGAAFGADPVSGLVGVWLAAECGALGVVLVGTAVLVTVLVRRSRREAAKA